MARLPRLLLIGVLIAGIAPLNGQSPAAGKPSINNGEWPDYSGDLRGWRYSPLDQINASNFNQLQVAWRFRTDNLGPRPDSWRGALAPRAPSRSLCIQTISPVAASSATTARRVPAVE